MIKKYVWVFMGALALVFPARAQESALAYLGQAKRLYQVKDYAGAEQALQAALGLDPQNATAHQLLGNVYFVQGRKAEAMAEYQLSLSLQPNNPGLRSFVQSQPPLPTPVAPPPPPAPPRDSLDPDRPHAILGLFGGPAFWGGIANQEDELETEDFSTGLGGGFFVGCQFDRHFSVALDLSVYNLPYTYVDDGIPQNAPGESTSLQEWQLLTVCRYLMGSGAVRPYISVGMGANLTLSTESEEGYSYTYATTVPLFRFGAGMAVPLGREWDLFAEVDYDWALYVTDNEDENFSFIPINLGLQYSP